MSLGGRLLRQICNKLPHYLISCLPCTVHSILIHRQIEGVRGRKVGMTCQLHHIEFTHAVGKPVTQGCFPKVIRRIGSNICTFQGRQGGFVLSTESFCKCLTKCLKGAGMRWDNDNAESVMALAGLYSSHLWEKYWNVHSVAA